MSGAFEPDLRGYSLQMDREERALLGLVRPGGGVPPGEAPDWEAVAAMARLHRLEPRLHRALEGLRPLDPPPPAVQEAWRRAYYASLHRVVELLHQRDRAVRGLAAAGVRPMVLKGAALAGTLYEDPALRPMGDIDLLVPPGTGGRVGELLPELERKGLVLHLFEIEEEHHDLTMDGAYRVDWDRLWREAVVSPFAGGAGLLPSLEDQLLAVCVSCCRNSFWNLVTLLDGAEILHRRGGELDWDRAVALARAMRLEAALDTLLALVGMLFGVRAPAGARERLRPPEWRRRLIGRLLVRFRLHAAEGMEEVNIDRPLGPFALKYAVNGPRVFLGQARAALLPDWRWMRAHYPEADRGEILLRYVAHPFVVAGLALRLLRDRGNRPPSRRG